jgi:transposase
MPRAHRRHAEWTIERIGREAAAIGPATATLTTLILQSRPHPEQGFRACLGILRLVRSYGRERVEAACSRGLEIGARSYGSIRSILQHGLDRRALPASSRADELPLLHPNIRGSGYYH